MLTAGNVQYEPPQRKAFSLTKKYTVMYAGDASVHSRIITDVVRQFAGDNDATVLKVAEAYGTHMSEYRKRECERLFLNPVGLTFADFIAHQNDLAPQTVDRLTSRIQGYRLDSEAIVMGIDAEPHIYVIQEPGIVICHDLVGFAAIGIGASHATSELMSARYSRQWGFARAVFQVFKAKKRPDVAPGVGQVNDLVDGDINQHWFLVPEMDPKDMLGRLQSTYQQEQEAARKATEIAQGEVVKYVEGLTTTPQVIEPKTGAITISGGKPAIAEQQPGGGSYDGPEE